MNVVAVINQKGGVAKTTTCANVGAALAARGLRTLLVDLDPQANLTLGVHADWTGLPYGLHDVLMDATGGRAHPLAPVIRQVGVNAARDLPLFLAPGHLHMTRAEVAMVRDTSPGTPAVYRLHHALRAYHAHARSASPAPAGFEPFDWVLLDCPPSLGPLTQSAIVASSHLLVPTEAKMYAFAGMDTLSRMIEDMSRTHDLRVRLLGVVITMYDRSTRLHRATEAVIRERFGDHVFATTIRRNVRLSEAEIEGRPAVLTDRRSAGAREYSALTEEIIARVAREEAATPLVPRQP